MRVFSSTDTTLDGGVVTLLCACSVNNVHLGELFVEGRSGQDAASGCLIVAKDCYSKACFCPDCCVQSTATKAPEAFAHVYKMQVEERILLFDREDDSSNAERWPTVSRHRIM